MAKRKHSMDWIHIPAVTILVLLAAIITGSDGFPDGPPESACADMKPRTRPGVVGLIGHLAQPQNELPTYGNSKRSPYYIRIHSPGASYEPGQEIQVSVVANQTSGLVMYKGLLLQARTVKCASDIGRDNETILVEDTPIGTFLRPSSDELLQTMTCGEIENSAISHKSPQFKIEETVTWVAPAGYMGHVVFRATIVQEAYIYWSNVHSRILIDPSDEYETAPTCDATKAQGYIMTVLGLFLLNRLL